MRVVPENYEQTHTRDNYSNLRCACVPRVNDCIAKFHTKCCIVAGADPGLTVGGC